MANYRLIIIEAGYENTEDQLQYPSVQAWQEASTILQNTYTINFNVQALIVSPAHYTNEDWFNRLNLRSFPVILITDANTNILLGRLGRFEITASTIVALFNRITQLTYSAEAGTFVYPDGRPIGQGGLIPGGESHSGGGGFLPIGGGMGNTPGLLFLLAGGLGAYQAVKSHSKTEKILWGSLGAYGVWGYFNKQNN